MKKIIDLKKRIEDELIEYGNALSWLDREGYTNKKYITEEVKIRKEFTNSILSLFSEYGEINPEWEKELGNFRIWQEDEGGGFSCHLNSLNNFEELKQFIRNQLRHEQRGKI